MEKGRTLAFQVSEELFQRVKEYLENYEKAYHRRLTQKEFVIGLIEQALEEAEEEFEAARAAEHEDVYKRQVQNYQDALEEISQEELQEQWDKAIEYNENLNGDPVHDPFVPGSGYVLPQNYEEVLNVCLLYTSRCV